MAGGATWGWDQGRFFLSFPNIYEKYFYLSTLLNSNKKTYCANIDLVTLEIIMIII
jgi:hypothetical protein